ncbi:MAG: NADH:ubiquinone reductase (Na(+)-transporting) subunit F [Gammaproteobacteria bacterium]|nr:NADH:ubiquinone reductase (Na(+)-transporting) subunit F [Gammaproteobacteria bacterium]
MQEIFVGAGLLTSIVMVLAAVVLLARSRLVPGGNVTITVNDDRDLSVPVGGNLLSALAANELFIPSACGGGGSCGQCRVTVLAGGGILLPIEASFITKREAAQGQRLACQVAVREQTRMRIRVPESVFGVRRWVCEVCSNNNVAPYIKELVLESPDAEVLDFRSGGYIQVECPPHKLQYADFDIPAEYQEDWKRYGLFKLESTAEEPVVRSYSMVNYPEEMDRILLNVRIATPPPAAPEWTPPGVVSSYLFSLKPGDLLTISGPFGDFLVKETNAEMVFVGGGVGMAPLRSHIFDQLKRLDSKRKISFWYGARSLREAFYVEQFDQLAAEHDNFKWYLTLSDPLPEDHWKGLSGFIHEVLFEHYLNTHPAPEDCEFYLCGPPMMIAALTNMFDELGVEEENIFFDDFGN